VATACIQAGKPGSAAWGALALMAAVHAVLAVGTLRQKSVTVDEFGHLPVGYNVLTTRDFAYCEFNPPLMNVLNAVPLLFMHPRDRGEAVVPSEPDLKYSLWGNGYVFMARFEADYHRLFGSARCMTVAGSVLLGGVVFVWAGQLSPRRPALAGLLAAGLVWYSPNMLAHAGLVTTDIGAAAFITLAAFTFYRYLNRPMWRRAILAGTALGVAQLVKFSAIYLYPVLLAAAIYVQVRHRAIPWGRWAMHGLCIVAVSIAVVNAGYLFQGTGRALGSLPVRSDALRRLQGALPYRTPVPLPQAIVLAFDRQLEVAKVGGPSFLFGKTYPGGRWYYFLALLAIKTPIPLLVIALAGLMVAVRRGGWPSAGGLLLLGLAGTLLAAFSLLSNEHVGLRLIMPAAPLFWVWATGTLAEAAGQRWHRGGIAALAAWTGLEAVRAYPDYLAYFNSFVGGSSRGYLYAADSNVDWGQDLIELKRYMDANDIDCIQLLYFGRVAPEVYGIRYVVPPPSGFRPGYAAVSVTLLALPYILYDHGTLIETLRPTRIDQAVTGPPVGRIGYSMLVFRVPDSARPAPF